MKEVGIHDGKKKDWEIGLTEEEMKEDFERFQRIKDYLQECNDLIDQMFPEKEEERKPFVINKGTKYWEATARTRGDVIRGANRPE